MHRDTAIIRVLYLEACGIHCCHHTWIKFERNPGKVQYVMSITTHFPHIMSRFSNSIAVGYAGCRSELPPINVVEGCTNNKWAETFSTKYEAASQPHLKQAFEGTQLILTFSVRLF
jgi:hypothetical protein